MIDDFQVKPESHCMYTSLEGENSRLGQNAQLYIDHKEALLLLHIRPLVQKIIPCFITLRLSSDWLWESKSSLLPHMLWYEPLDQFR